MKNKTFISHSSLDKPIVLKLAEILERENIWFDAWNMDIGDPLSEKIEEGIDEAKNFLIILSKNSLGSRWVQYELNMALIKYLEDKDYKILVARIDDVEVPLRLKPFLRVECNTVDNDETAKKIYDSIFAKHENKPQRSSKRQFVNRHDEITSLQDLFFDEKIKFISIIGFYGIGKTSLSQEALRRIFSAPRFVEINLSQAHFGSRLTLDLCSKANIQIPADGTPDEELTKLNLLSIETILSSGSFVIFNRFETVLDDSGVPNSDIVDILEYFKDSNILTQFPIVILSTRWPNLSCVNRESVGQLKIEGLSNKHLTHIIKSEIERSSTTLQISEVKIDALSILLHGYPLAGKLAASFVVKYGSVDYLVDNLHIVNQIKIDIAGDIISKIELKEQEVDILELLAIFEKPLNPFYIGKVYSINSDELNEYIDNLVAYNLLDASIDGITLHPLVNDFYLKLARSNPNFSTFSEKLAKVAKERLLLLKTTDKDYVYWLTNTCRLLLYSGKLEEGKQLRQDLIGEVKSAAIKLYQRRDYATSLRFCDDFLETKPYDKNILFTKSRCLSRLGRLGDSIAIIEKLIEGESNKFLLAKYNYALGRTYIENCQEHDEQYLNKAETYFMKSIRLNEHESALQSMGELLFRKGKLDDAASFIERKLKSSPTDPFALSIYSDILWSLDRKAEAVSKIIEVLKHQPKNPNFLFRAGRFLQEEGNPSGAYKYFNDAINNDPDYVDARLSLADVCLDLNEMKEATQHIDILTKKVVGEKKYILESIKANLALKLNDIDQALLIANTLVKKNRSIANLGLLAKVYITKYKENQSKGLALVAKLDKDTAIDLIKEGLDKEANNERLQNMLHSLT